MSRRHQTQVPTCYLTYLSHFSRPSMYQVCMNSNKGTTPGPGRLIVKGWEVLRGTPSGSTCLILPSTILPGSMITLIEVHMKVLMKVEIKVLKVDIKVDIKEDIKVLMLLKLILILSTLDVCKLVFLFNKISK